MRGSEEEWRGGVCGRWVRVGKDRQDRQSAGRDKTGQDKIGPKGKPDRVRNRTTVGKVRLVGGNIVCPCSLRLA